MLRPKRFDEYAQQPLRRLSSPARAGRRNARRQRGAVVVLAMMFLVIFSSLAAAMAIVAGGNLSTADTQLKAARAAAGAETGLRFSMYQLAAAAATVETSDGLITDDNAPDLWVAARTAMLAALTDNAHNLAEPAVDETGVLTAGPIQYSPTMPTFMLRAEAHPIAGEDYDGSYYQRPPFDAMILPFDATWVRLTATCDVDGIARTIAVDCRIDKKIRYALLAKSRVMVGRNVSIDGAIGSTFTETHLTNGHPIVMVSDFVGFDNELDDAISALSAVLLTNDLDRDNRIDLESAAETAGIDNPAQYDRSGDGYIDDYDYFLEHFDVNTDGVVTAIELDATDNIETAQLLQLIDTYGSPTRPGYNDGRIDNDDQYAKLHGQASFVADYAGWIEGAAGGNIHDYYQGPIKPDYGEAPSTFEADPPHDFDAGDFDTSTFRTMATGDLAQQAEDQTYSPTYATEAAPFGAAHPYDYYDRPVYDGLTFTDVTIPRGTNALFRNCTFIGVTFIDTAPDNGDPNYNQAGMTEADGTLKHPGAVAVVDGEAVADTKTVANNLRFDSCTFEGAIVGETPAQFTHVRNKIAFTGQTQFAVDTSSHLTDTEKLLYKRSSILMPHYSVEVGSFIDPSSGAENVTLSGTIVAGVIDIRGQVDVTGTILTTFEPQSETQPVIGETSPQFNTTLGYFPSTAGDLEAEMPDGGVGVIHLRYDPTTPLPDGILGPIEIRPVMSTYFEKGL